MVKSGCLLRVGGGTLVEILNPRDNNHPGGRMPRHGRLALAAALMLFGLCDRADARAAPPPFTRNVAAALRALEGPLVLEAPFFGGRTHAHLFPLYTNACTAEIEHLVATREHVDRVLLRLARSPESHIRFRAILILARRGNRAAAPLLDGLCASKSAGTRYLGWIAREQAAESRLLVPRDHTRDIALYRAEKDNEVRERIEWYFSSAKVKAAGPALLDRLQQDPGALGAIWALGMIGEVKAVPAIIAAYEKDGNTHYHLIALGRLGTEQAIDFIIAHLDEYGAVDGLLLSGSKKALPALQKHQARLRQRKKKRDDDDLIMKEIRIAIVRLSKKDPRADLLALAEDRRENSDVRFAALRALQEYDHVSLHRRVLALYNRESDGNLKRACIWLLEASKEKGVTEAMIEHARALTIESKGDLATEFYLRKALNRRLGTMFNSRQGLQDHLKAQQQKQDQDGDSAPSRTFRQKAGMSR
jgi:HEAT repeat protein